MPSEHIINGLLITVPDGAVVGLVNAVETSTKITKLAFRNRFTFSEKVTIEDAAITDSEVRVLVKDQDSAEFIDVSRIDTIQGVALLVNKQLITLARSSEILSTNILGHERIKGDK